ncbi:MAG: C39 family peptidase [Methylocystaceae bacterium]|nr:C39 family peptidase [Methylocystaceae bacterium]
MERRQFIVGAAATTGFGAVPEPSKAYTRCNGVLCEAGLRLPEISKAYQNQKMSQWCWAASIQMVFRYYGYHVSQPDIVRETYGHVGNIPAVTGLAISRNLQRSWKDSFGNYFSVEIEGLYDFDLGITNISDSQIISAMNSERPIVIGTTSHAMVLTAVAFDRKFDPPRIVNIGFADPWPYGPSLRGGQIEGVPMHRGGMMRYLCLPRVI